MAVPFSRPISNNNSGNSSQNSSQSSSASQTPTQITELEQRIVLALCEVFSNLPPDTPGSPRSPPEVVIISRSPRIQTSPAANTSHRVFFSQDFVMTSTPTRRVRHDSNDFASLPIVPPVVNTPIATPNQSLGCESSNESDASPITPSSYSCRDQLPEFTGRIPPNRKRRSQRRFNRNEESLIFSWPAVLTVVLMAFGCGVFVTR